MEKEDAITSLLFVNQGHLYISNWFKLKTN